MAAETTTYGEKKIETCSEQDLAALYVQPIKLDQRKLRQQTKLIKLALQIRQTHNYILPYMMKDW